MRVTLRERSSRPESLLDVLEIPDLAQDDIPGGVRMNVSEAIRTKRAIRKFQDKPLPEDVIHAILNAGRRSQSSKNEQARAGQRRRAITSSITYGYF